MSGIYKIESKAKPNQIYIGSAVCIKHRWYCHLSELRLNKHRNKKLQNHFNKYGEADLCFSVIYSCSKEELISKEQFYIDSNNPYFNICRIAGSLLGTKRDAIAKKKMSDAWKNRKPFTQATKDKISIKQKGRIKSINERINISNALKGKTLTESVKIKIRDKHIGKHLTSEHRLKITKSLIGNKRTLGYKQSEETQNKKRLHSPNRNGSNNPRYGVKVSVDTKNKMKESQLKRWSKVIEMRRLESSFSTK